MNDINTFLQHSQAHIPIIAGPMYPCSNPELIAAVSNTGALGIIQPISLTYVHGYGLQEGIQYIRSLTSRPIGMNVLIEKSSSKYQQRMQQWIDIALDNHIRFFITSLGKPDWVVKQVHAAKGVVYHDVTEKKWAQIAIDNGVDGLIAVNNRAGGHTGEKTPQQLFHDLQKYSLPIVCAGGIGTPHAYQQALQTGYSAVQMGTRFIASCECTVPQRYKDAILQAEESDIVLSERITGIPVSVIMTPYIKKWGLTGNIFDRWLLRHKKLKHWLRLFYTLRSGRRLKTAIQYDDKEFWQAGKSVAGIHHILPVAKIIETFEQSR